MDLYFGTVVRSAPLKEGGQLYRLDWNRKKVLSSRPIFPESPSLDHDPNPRGNARGCRGVQVVGEKVIAASYHTIHLFDLSLRPEASFSHELMAGVHEVTVSGPGRIWIASTALDAALEFDWETGRLLNEFWPREMPFFQKNLDLTALPLNKAADQRAAFLGGETFSHPSHLHLNAVAEWQESVYALFPTREVIANLTEKRIAVKDPALRGAHNLVILEEEGIAFVNDTLGQTVRLYDLGKRKLLKSLSLKSIPWVRDLAASCRASAQEPLPGPEVARPLFQRGLAVTGPWVFVGMSPGSILCLDWDSGKFVDAFQLSEDVRVCLHGLAANV